MKFVHILYITFFLSGCAGAASCGTIRFTGMITEPACTVAVYSQRSVVQCIRGGTSKQLSYVHTKYSQPSPFALAGVKLEHSGQRRDITLVYR